MTSADEGFEQLRAARAQFLELIADIRPDLHRYCARMTGSVTDGEDVVQETLARAFFRLAELPNVPELRPWLFRVAHNCAIDVLRRRQHAPLEAVVSEEPTRTVAAETVPADEALARREASVAALARFLELPPVPRSAVILKDVLDHSLEEIAAQLEISLSAVKAALHRGRRKIRQAGLSEADAQPPAQVSPALERYVTLFNARDWAGVRAMLADEVRLDLVTRARWTGARQVGTYLSNYNKRHDWHLRVGRLGAQVVVLVYANAQAESPRYFMVLGLEEGQVVDIVDYRYVPYITTDADLTPG